MVSVRAAVRRVGARTLLVGLVVVGVVLPVAIAAPGGPAAGPSAFTEVPSASQRPDRELPQPDDLPDVQRRLGDAAARKRAQREWRASPDQRAQREASGRGFAGLGRDDALRVAREQHGGLVSRPIWRPVRLRDGERSAGYVNDHTMRIDRAGADTHALVWSPVPLRAVDDDGKRRAVDLSLEQRDGALVPANSPAKVRFPERLEEGIRLELADVSVRPELTAGSAGAVEVGGKAFYANVAPDTDFLVAPLPRGVETFHQLRSEHSPETLPLVFDLPKGAELRPVARGQAGTGRDGGAEVVRDGKVIAAISAPTAFDADREPVAVDLEIVGADRLSLRVSHREADVKYPLLVDPVIDEWDFWDGSSPYPGWSYASGPPGMPAGPLDGRLMGDYDRGLYVVAEPDRPYGSQVGQWAAFAPGTSYIYRVEFGDVIHDPWNSIEYEGIFSTQTGGWEPGVWTGDGNDSGPAPWVTAEDVENVLRIHCVYYTCDPAGTPGNAAVFGMAMFGPTGPYEAQAYLANAALFLHDDDTPQVSVSHSEDLSRWVNHQVRTTVTASDTGLGVYETGIDSDGQGDFDDASPRDHPELGPCGDHLFRCPNNDTKFYDLDVPAASDGPHQVRAYASDPIDHQGETPWWTVRVDNTEPEITVGGSLRSMAGRDLTADSYRLSIDANDKHPTSQSISRSGVRSVQVKLAGNQAYFHEQPDPSVSCPGTGCTMVREWEFRPYEAGLPLGQHTIEVIVTDHAGNRATDTFNVRTVAGAMTSPRSGDVSEKRFKLRAVAKYPYANAAFMYRRASTDAWATIPAAHLRTLSGGPVSGTAQPLTDNATAALLWDVGATLGADGPVQVRAHFNEAQAAPSNTITAAFKPNGVGADYAREDLGPGRVDLLTGNLIVTEDDVKIDSYVTDLTVSRSWVSRAAGANPAGPFGAGWVPSVLVEAAGADYVKLEDRDSAVVLTLADSTTVQFVKTAIGYDPPAGHEDLRLTKKPAELVTLIPPVWEPERFELVDVAANKAVFTKPSGAGDFYPRDVSTPGSATATNFEYAVVGGVVRVTRALAPRPQGVSSCAPLVAGCRELQFGYASATTATGTAESQWGDYQGRMRNITFHSADAGFTVARYEYDSEGRLRAQWDPRITPALKTTYDYDTDGLLIKTTPPGEAPWSMAYQANPGETQPGRLRSVSRTGPSGTATSTVVYDVPLSGAGAPYAMGESDVAGWAQSDAPADATAIFPPDQIPAGSPPSSYSRATVHYLNGNGRKVNTAVPGGHITTSEYDEHHNVIRQLTASNRARALAAGDPAARAREIDTQSTYDASGLELRDKLEPRHEVQLASSQVVQARRHTVTTYDGGGLHLPTTVRVGARLDGPGADVDVRTTTMSYDNGGVALRKPTVSTVDPDGLALRSRAAYDAATGLELSRTMPKGNPNGTDAHTRHTVYYTAGANSTDAACGHRPLWANLVCKTTGVQPTGGLPPLPVTTFEYNYLLQPTRSVETAASHTRTTTKTYDDAGRLLTETTTATTGTAVPAVTHDYDPQTGRQTVTRTSDPNATIQRTYDSLGRQTAYKDADDVTSTTTYDLLNRPVTINDAKATQTLTYQPDSGRLAIVSDPMVGDLIASYDADGQIATKHYPNGLTATVGTDEAGQRRYIVYQKNTNCGATCDWLYSLALSNIHAQHTWQYTGGQTGLISTNGYVYDQAARLRAVSDVAGSSSSCTMRLYGYDDDSNRTAQQTMPPAPDGACHYNPAAPIQTTTHDQADRITNTGFEYDHLGRTLTVPADHAGGTQLTSTYNANDLAKTLQQDGTTRSYTRDPARRINRRDTTTASGTTTETYHYSDDTDKPAWIAPTGGPDYTRMIEGPDGDLAAQRDNTATRLQLTNLHGDIVADASTDPNATALNIRRDNTEFGVPRQPSGARHQWLGSKQRSTELNTGTIAMGVRTYLPQLGRFLQRDPVVAGSANDYDYVNQDPVNVFDVEGLSAPGNCIGRRQVHGQVRGQCRLFAPRRASRNQRAAQLVGEFAICSAVTVWSGPGGLVCGGAVVVLNVNSIYSENRRVRRYRNGRRHR